MTAPARQVDDPAEQRPDLQALVAAHGGYHKITPEAWAAYDRELRQWRARTAVGDFSPSVGRPLGLSSYLCCGRVAVP